MSKITEEIKQLGRESRAYYKHHESSPPEPDDLWEFSLGTDEDFASVEVRVHTCSDRLQLEIEGSFLSVEGERLLQDILNGLHPRRARPRKPRAKQGSKAKHED